MTYKISIIIVITLFLFSCKEKKDIPSDQLDSLKNVDSAFVDSGLVESNILKNAPDWFKNIPNQDGFIYGIGTAKSRRLNLASDKAVTKAQISLAEQVKKKTESTIGADSDEISESDLNVVLTKSVIKNQTQIKEGKLWRSYVLIEMEIE